MKRELEKVKERFLKLGNKETMPYWLDMVRNGAMVEKEMCKHCL